MGQWLAFDVLLSFVPVALVWLGTYLVGRFHGWLHPLRDGQLCFFAVTLAATTLRDVYRSGRPGEIEAAVTRLGGLVREGSEAPFCRALQSLAELPASGADGCLPPPPDLWVAWFLLILVIVFASFVFGIGIAVTSRAATDGQRDDRLAWTSVWITVMAIVLVGVIRYYLGL